MQNGSLQDRAANSDTLLTVVMAVRKTNMIVKNQSGPDLGGPKGGCNRDFSTVPKSRVGKNVQDNCCKRRRLYAHIHKYRPQDQTNFLVAL